MGESDVRAYFLNRLKFSKYALPSDSPSITPPFAVSYANFIIYQERDRAEALKQPNLAPAPSNPSNTRPGPAPYNPSNPRPGPKPAAVEEAAAGAVDHEAHTKQIATLTKKIAYLEKAGIVFVSSIENLILKCAHRR